MLVTACSQAPNAFNNDPLELVNRKTHELNKFIDGNFISPISVGYSALAPDPLENSLSNFSGNLSLSFILMSTITMKRSDLDINKQIS